MKTKNKIITAVALVFFGILFSFVNVFAATPTVSFNPTATSIAPGATIVVSATGMPSGSTLIIYENSVKVNSVPSGQNGNVILNINSSDSNFSATGNNTVTFSVLDSNGNQIASNGTALQFTINSQGNSGASGTNVANAGSNGATGAGSSSQNAPTTDCTATPNSPNCLYNPLPTGDFTTFVLLIMKWLLGFIGVFAVLFIMIGGFKMITAQGNQESVEAAKKTITWAVAGLIVAVLSFSMIAIVENLLQANISNNTGASQTTTQ